LFDPSKTLKLLKNIYIIIWLKINQFEVFVQFFEAGGFNFGFIHGVIHRNCGQNIEFYIFKIIPLSQWFSGAR